ncbi:MAG: protein kinase domain-containing protein, partial [Planctomycetia bacterium]
QRFDPSPLLVGKFKAPHGNSPLLEVDLPRKLPERVTFASGLSTRPNTCLLASGRELAEYLPHQRPRFQEGDRLPHLPWVVGPLLGAGGMGETYLGRHPYLPNMTSVALKFFCDPKVNRKQLEHEVARAMEAQAAGLGTGFVRLNNAHLDVDPPCLEFEYVAGGTLAAWVEDRKRSGSRLTVKEATDLDLRLATILKPAHSLNPPLVHRDLKPANILLDKGPDGKLRLKLTDWGIALRSAAPGLASTPHVASRAGTMTQMALGAYTPLMPRRNRNSARNRSPATTSTRWA